MHDTLFIGYCEYEPNNHTRISCEAQYENGAWIKKDLTRHLPPVGKVFAVSLPQARRDQYIALTTEPNPRLVDPEKDHLILNRSWPLREVINMQGVDLETLRRKVLIEGFSNLAIGPNEVVIAINDSECIIVPLKETIDRDRWVADPGQFKVHRFDSRLFMGNVIGQRFREVPEITVGPALREIALQDDQTILNGILKRLKTDTGDGPSRNERERIISYLNHAKAFQASNNDNSGLLDWTVNFLGRIHDHLETVPLIVDALKAAPEIQEDLNRALEDEKAKLKEMIRAEAEAEVQKDIQSLLDQKEELNDGLNDLEEKLQNLSASSKELNDIKESFRRQLMSEIEALGGALEDISNGDEAEFEELLSRFRASLGQYGDQLTVADISLPPWISPRPKPATIIPATEFETALRRAAIRSGIDISDVEYVDLCLRARAPLLLPQDAAERIIPSYANIVSGGIYYREIVGPGTITLDDLWSRPASGVEGGLRQAWTAARKAQDRFHIVWLDRVDTAPLKLWLPSFLGVLDSSDRPENLMVCMSLKGPHVEPEMAVRDLSRYVLGASPKLGRMSSTLLLRQAQGETEQPTVLPYQDPKLLEEDELRDRIEAMAEPTPQDLAFEIRMHQAACFLGDTKASPSKRIARLSGLRKAGCAWIDEMMHKEKTKHD
ncbi:coiled-coil domain-containing protein [Roseovarius mucosus]|uniref:coiled-coil domain-containing protein n=1 Tax=Roseovarius mucosus TaxID=215743 RepID=UPI0035D0BACF